jgi:hypothetical protein
MKLLEGMGVADPAHGCQCHAEEGSHMSLLTVLPLHGPRHLAAGSHFLAQINTSKALPSHLYILVCSHLELLACLSLTSRPLHTCQLCLEHSLLFFFPRRNPADPSLTIDSGTLL